ncbi:type II toxin-antitoxin system VapC family toxin [Thiohalophilus sp.]|uniref:type II toxin-antitoxin system VapC family toxin n=1 Tax=Thiohalophilus sp. TaxID=3028392 RepID=UPI002ACDD0FD|nr:type II toxin-antitoxin system VapC family toxin [Thiohalophilus sp.]MDZ7662837.1 type II toxin-antitoxin system VapC family toxin [Thiohalophilus sp.]
MIDLSDLAEGSWVTIDTAPLIYLLEDNTTFLETYLPLFEEIEAGRLRGVVSVVTLAELLAGPLRNGDEILADRYYQSLSSSSHWQVQEMNASLAFTAARIRIRYGLKLPDAIQVATAIYTNSAALVVHDRDFRQVTEIPVIGIC